MANVMENFLRIISESRNREEIKKKLLKEGEFSRPIDKRGYCEVLFILLFNRIGREIKRKAFVDYLIDDFKEAKEIDMLLTLAFAFEDADDFVWIDNNREMMGLDSSLKNIYHKAQLEIPLMIVGETGTGKEAMANVIHTISPRRGKPFVSVNCAAIPENLIESELFGHEEGAFTGALGQRKGLIESAKGGTLFLDELGRASTSFQNKLLRFLDGKGFYRVGGDRLLKFDVRIVAAAQNATLRQIEDDLKYRFGYPQCIHVPPLREKLQMIFSSSRVIENILERVARRLKLKEDIYHAGAGISLIGLLSGGSKQRPRDNEIRLHQECYTAFKDYDWPGNYRELESALQEALINAYFNNGRYELRLSDFSFIETKRLIDAFLKEAVHKRKTTTFEKINLKDIVSHADKMKAEIVEAKVMELVKSGVKDFKKVLIDEGLPETQYPSFMTQVKRITGKGARDFIKQGNALTI